MRRIVWCSRHPLGDEQLANLEDLLGEEVEIEQVNVTWKSSADADEDRAENLATWLDIVDRAGPAGSGLPVVCGVFPPVAFEALRAYRSCPRAVDLRVLAPVSAQSSNARRNSSAQIPFVHVRWAEFLVVPGEGI